MAGGCLPAAVNIPPGGIATPMAALPRSNLPAPAQAAQRTSCAEVNGWRMRAPLKYSAKGKVLPKGLHRYAPCPAKA